MIWPSLCGGIIPSDLIKLHEVGNIIVVLSGLFSVRKTPRSGPKLHAAVHPFTCHHLRAHAPTSARGWGSPVRVSGETSVASTASCEPCQRDKFFFCGAFFLLSARSLCSGAAARVQAAESRHAAGEGGREESARSSLSAGGSPPMLPVPARGSDSRLAAKAMQRRKRAGPTTAGQKQRWQRDGWTVAQSGHGNVPADARSGPLQGSNLNCDDGQTALGGRANSG